MRCDDERTRERWQWRCSRFSPTFAVAVDGFVLLWAFYVPVNNSRRMTFTPSDFGIMFLCLHMRHTRVRSVYAYGLRVASVQCDPFFRMLCTTCTTRTNANLIYNRESRVNWRDLQPDCRCRWFDDARRCGFAGNRWCCSIVAAKCEWNVHMSS